MNAVVEKRCRLMDFALWLPVLCSASLCLTSVCVAEDDAKPPPKDYCKEFPEACRADAFEREHHEKQEGDAKSILDELGGVNGDMEPVDDSLKHPYYHGTDEYTIKKNNIEHDLETIILGLQTPDKKRYEKCQDYRQIGWCINLLDPKEPLIPFTAYRVPVQKVENVPEPFRTGYVEKSIIEEQFEQVLNKGGVDYYNSFAPEVTKDELNFARNTAQGFTKRMTGAGEYYDAEKDDIKEGTKEWDIIKGAAFDATLASAKNRALSWQTTSGKGWVNNDYHVLPTHFPIQSPIPPNDGREFWGYCPHVAKQPYPFFGEEPDHIFYSRDALWTYKPELYPLQMSILFHPKFGNPLNCANYNMFSGKTAKGTLPELVSFPPLPFPCQGINQGMWVPLTNRVHTEYQTTAAAVGTTRGIKLAHGLNPMSFYDITMFRDRVQWARNDRMDGIDDKTGEEIKDPRDKPCNNLEKFVLDYKKGNLVHHPLGKQDPKMDHWNVTIHWRQFQCCMSKKKRVEIPPPFSIILNNSEYPWDLQRIYE